MDTSPDPGLPASDRPDPGPKVRWDTLLPHELLERLREAPVAYLPLGTLEWHGPHLPLGADALQSHGFFLQLARRAGGVVLPPLFLGPDSRTVLPDGREQYGMDVCGSDFPPERRYPDQQLPGSAYHVEESAFVDMIRAILKQVARAGVRVVVAHGHGPSVWLWQRRTPEWEREFGLRLLQGFGDFTIPEEIELGFMVDHAGHNETSITWHLYPDLVDMDRLPKDPAVFPTAIGHGDPRLYASPELGARVVRHQLDRMAALVGDALADWRAGRPAVAVSRPEGLPGQEGLVFTRDIREDAPGRIVLTARVENRTGGPVALGDLEPWGLLTVSGPDRLDRALVLPRTMLGEEGILTRSEGIRSEGFLGLAAPDGQPSVALGFVRPDDAFYRFDAARETRPAGGTAWRIRAVCPREDTLLPDGAVLSFSPLWILTGPDGLTDKLETLARAVADTLGTRVPADIAAGTAPPLSGWCSWYHYYGQETEADILANLSELAAPPLAGKVRVLQVDDGWNLPEPGHPRVWGDWHPGAKFPRGMKALVDDIRRAGLQAGLWLAPFTVTKDSRLYREHPDWLVGEDPGSVLAMPDFGLDLTHPGVLAWLDETFRRVFDDWGFDYVKLDFLLYGSIPGRRHDPSKTGAEAFRMGLDLVRRLAGDRFVLACGSPLLPAAGLVDGMRIGPDVGARWALPINPGAWPYGNCALRPALVYTLYRQYMNGILWQNDPDCLVVRDFGTREERRSFGETFLGHPMTEAEYGLSLEQARTWAEAIRRTGGMRLLSEVYSGLSPDRQALALSMFGPTGSGGAPYGRARLRDRYDDPDFLELQCDDGVARFDLLRGGMTLHPADGAPRP